MTEGEARRANAFAADELRMKIRDVKRAELAAIYDQASQDPEFLADLAATTRAIDTTVADGLAELAE